MNNNNIPQTSAVTQKKKKRKFNFIDFLIVLMIVAIISVVVYALSPWSQIKKLWTSEEVTLQYAVEFKDVDASFIDLIKNGHEAINSVNKSSLGKVNRIAAPEISTVLDYQLDAEKGVAQGILVEKDNKYNLTVYITATAKYEPNVGYTVNGSRIAVGEELFFRFPEFSCSGYCIAIEAD